MKTRKIYVLFFLLLLLSAAAAYALPPDNMVLSWDSSTGTLSVTADHPVNDGTKHYIMAMYISSDGNQMLTKEYHSQPSKEIFSDSVRLEGAAPGTVVTVELVCNIMGNAKKEITLK